MDLIKYAVVVLVALTMLFATSVIASTDGAAGSNPVVEKEVAKKPGVDIPIKGKIVETMNAGGYTYCLLDIGAEKVWVAVRAMDVKVGQEVEFEPGIEMPKFTSKSLNRTFDSIIFSGGPVRNKGSESDAEAMKKAHGGKTMEEMVGGKAKPAEPKKDESGKIDKVATANGYTVAELFQKKADLDAKEVTVRGKVVKVSPDIMGKTWVHLQDGSGDAGQGTNDLVVTTQETPAVGTVVTVNGTLAKDKDFGGGYKFVVIVENARITP